MAEGARLPRVLFWSACAAAGLLVLLVLVSPCLQRWGACPGGWRQVLTLFAQDQALRRTCVASAAGLLVTACVFFQPAPPTAAGRRPPPRRPRSPGVARA